MSLTAIEHEGAGHVVVTQHRVPGETLGLEELAVVAVDEEHWGPDTLGELDRGDELPLLGRLLRAASPPGSLHRRPAQRAVEETEVCDTFPADGGPEAMITSDDAVDEVGAPAVAEQWTDERR